MLELDCSAIVEPPFCSTELLELLKFSGKFDNSSFAELLFWAVLFGSIAAPVTLSSEHAANMSRLAAIDNLSMRVIFSPRPFWLKGTTEDSVGKLD